MQSLISLPEKLSSPKGEAEVASLAENVVSMLSEETWCCFDGVFPTPFAYALRHEAEKIFSCGLGKAAGVGGAADQHQRIRGDSICWLDEQTVAASPALQAFLTFAEVLRGHMNWEGFLGLRSFECHAAHYPPGSRYAPHWDNVRGHDSRMLTMLFYLNSEWKGECAGQLHGYGEEGAFELAPVMNRLVLFKSRELRHEVKLSHCHRYSLTGWFHVAGN